MDREETRSKIVRKASEEILVRGYTRVTMDQIASGLGMSKKTLYRVFPGKREMLRAVLNDLTSFIDKGVMELMARTDLEFIDRLQEIMRFIAGQYGRIGQGFVEDLRQSEPDVLDSLENFRDGLVQRYFSRLIREGVEIGAFRQELDPRIMGLVYVASMRHVMNPRTVLELHMAPNELYEGIFRLLFEGMLADEARALYRARLAVRPAVTPTDSAIEA